MLTPVHFKSFVGARRALAWAAGLSALLAVADGVVADEVFNSFGTNETVDTSYNALTISGGGGVALAVKFVPSTAYQIVDVQAALKSTGGNNVSSLVAAIYPDSGGVPSTTAIWTSVALIVPAMTGIYTFTSTATATFASGQPYWVVFTGTISSGNAAVAFPGLPHVMGTLAQKSSTSAWSATPSTVVPAVIVDGAIMGSCCNRATGGCSVVGQAACAALGLNFGGAGTACVPTACTACPADFNNSGSVTVQDIFDFLAAWFAGCH